MKVARQENSRDRILEASLNLFSRYGYAATSMRQIAATVGMRAPSLYNHFAGKEAILGALMGAYGSATSAGRLASARYLALADDPAGFCRRYAADSLEQWLDHDERRFMELLSAERDRLGDQRDRLVKTLFETEVGIAADYFRRFSLTGRIYAPDPKECARLFIAALAFVRMEYLTMPFEPAPAPVIREALERTVSNFIRLVAPRR